MTPTSIEHRDVVIIGAGLAGLAAAQRLGPTRRVAVLDKGRSVGGRLATRRIGEARLDHGAQFMTVRSAAFAEQMAAWERDGLTRVWHRGFGDDGHDRHVATGGMNSLAKDLAGALEPLDTVEIMTSQMVMSISMTDDVWRVLIDDGTAWEAPAVIVTAPIPQAVALLIDSGVQLPNDLARIDYQHTIALLAVLDDHSAIAPPGMVDPADLDGTIWSFVGDQQLKGISAIPAICAHGNARWSRDHWDETDEVLAETLIESLTPHLGGAGIVEAQVKRWRLAMPERLWPAPYWASDPAGLWLTGDAFASSTAGHPNAEGAYLSGLAAADALIGDIPPPPDAAGRSNRSS